MKLVVQKLILSFVFFYFAAAISYSADLADIKKRGYINIGVALGGEPIGFWDEKNNPIGYDIDFAEKLAKALGVNVSLINVHGDARISMLVSG